MAGISTIGITLVPEITRKVRPSRTLFIEHPFGLTFGDVEDTDLQKEILLRCLVEALQYRERGGTLTLPYQWNKDDLRRRQLLKQAS